MPAPKLIGIYADGPGSGKSHVARVLENEFRYNTVKFAGPVKEIADLIYKHMGFDERDRMDMLEGHLKEAPMIGYPDLTSRKVQQIIGTEFGRELIHPDLWVRIARNRIERYLNFDVPVKIIVDDMRFENEFALIKELGGVTMRIKRKDIKDTEEHPSEGALSKKKFDIVINNDKDVETLERKVIEAIRKFN